MKVQDVMVKDVRFCSPDTNLANVTKIFWEQGCGALPVVENGRAIGMVTDRDVSIALGTRNAKAGDTCVRDVALAKVFFCLAEDDIHTALEILRAQQVRRLVLVPTSTERRSWSVLLRLERPSVSESRMNSWR